MNLEVGKPLRIPCRRCAHPVLRSHHASQYRRRFVPHIQKAWSDPNPRIRPPKEGANVAQTQPFRVFTMLELPISAADREQFTATFIAERNTRSASISPKSRTPDGACQTPDDHIPATEAELSETDKSRVAAVSTRHCSSVNNANAVPYGL